MLKRNRRVKIGPAILCRGMMMRGSGILQDADNLGFWQDVAVIQGQKQRFADGECCRA